MSPLLLWVIMTALLTFLIILRPSWTWAAVWALLLVIGIPPVAAACFAGAGACVHAGARLLRRRRPARASFCAECGARAGHWQGCAVAA